MKECKVSVIVPVYNVHEFLEACLESLLCQSLRDIEIICVDDGSTDTSPAILASYAAKDSRVRVITKPNAGYGHTMNTGIDAANGEYIGIVEADDLASPNMYAELYEAAKRESAQVVKADFIRFVHVNGRREDTLVTLAQDESWYGRIVDPSTEPLALRLSMNTWTGIYETAYLKEKKIRHNETPGASYQDNGFFFQTMCQSHRVLFIHKAYYLNRRDNPGSSVYDKGKVYAMCGEMAFIKDFLKSHDGYWEIFKDIYYTKLLDNYEFTYNRIAQECRAEFIEHISKEFNEAEQSGDLNINTSYTKAESVRVRILIDNPKAYPAFDAIRAQGNTIRALRSEIAALKGSASYRIGRMITSIPRKIRGIIRR